MNQRIKGLINLARKSNSLVVGCDNINKAKNLYVILLSPTASDTTLKIANKIAKKFNIKQFKLEDEIAQMIGIENCQVVGITNSGFAKEIMNIIERGE